VSDRGLDGGQCAGQFLHCFCGKGRKKRLRFEMHSSSIVKVQTRQISRLKGKTDNSKVACFGVTSLLTAVLLLSRCARRGDISQHRAAGVPPEQGPSPAQREGC